MASRHASAKAAVNSRSDGEPPVPLARASTVSLVDVHPSTVIEPNEPDTDDASAEWSTAGSTSASVVRTASIVAMSGASIAAPLAIPPTV
jgi:hypothetical protein